MIHSLNTPAIEKTPLSSTGSTTYQKETTSAGKSASTIRALGKTAVVPAPRLRASQDASASLKAAPANQNGNLRGEHRELSSGGATYPFLKPDSPQSFSKDLSLTSLGRNEFLFAVDDVYGVEIVVNSDSKVGLSYDLYGTNNFDPVFGKYTWGESGSVTPGEPLDTTKLLEPGIKYKLEIKSEDIGFDLESKGTVGIHRFDAKEAARFAKLPSDTNLDHRAKEDRFQEFTTLPIKVGSEYEDQQFNLNFRGGCYTVYPCKGQDKVRISTVLEDRLFAKYGRISFRDSVYREDNILKSIYSGPGTDGLSRYQLAEMMWTEDHDNDLDNLFTDLNSTKKREWFNEFDIGSGKLATICVGAPSATAGGRLKPLDEGEQTLFPFSVMSLGGKNSCDLSNAYGWNRLSPREPGMASGKKLGLALGLGVGIPLAVITAGIWYCSRKTGGSGSGTPAPSPAGGRTPPKNTKSEPAPVEVSMPSVTSNVERDTNDLPAANATRDFSNCQI